MAQQIEKLLTPEQQESIVMHFVDELQLGNKFTVIDKDSLIMDTLEQKYSVSMSVFDNTKIFRLRITNKKSRNSVHVDKYNVKHMKEFLYIQNEVSKILNPILTPKYYSDDELGDIIGDDPLLLMRSKKVEHIIDHIEEEKKHKWRKRFKRP
jgi:hypothetical protein